MSVSRALLFALPTALALAAQPSAAGASESCPKDGVEQLLGGGGCQAQEAFVQRVSRRLTGDPNKIAWEQFSRWGRELFRDGSVASPPAPPIDAATGRSQQLSNYRDYVCLRCHNDQREDPPGKLADPDPEARFTYVEQQRASDPQRYANLEMVQGTTLWGAVNRIAFYNGLYAPYHDLPVPTPESYPLCKPGQKSDCTPAATQSLDPRLLDEALQVCARFCSDGRYMEDWELAAMLTYLWDNQVRLADTDLTPEQKKWVGQVLMNPHLGSYKDLVPRAKMCLESGYLRVPGETRRDDPGAASGRPPPPPPDACDRDARVVPGLSSELQAPARRSQETVALTELDRDAPALIRHFMIPRDREAIRAFEASLDERAARAIYASRAALPPTLRATPQLRRGERLYELTCANCHGPDPETGRPLIGGRGHRFLAGSKYLFYSALQQGIVRGGGIPYMPEFTVERLSDSQARDLLLYLLTLEPEGSIEVTWTQP